MCKSTAVGQEAWIEDHSLVECLNFRSGLLVVNKAGDLQLALMGRVVLATKVDTVGIEPERA